MTPQQIVGLGVRLFAIWLVVIAIQMLGYGVALDAQQSQEKTVVPYAITVVFLVAAVGLWLFPMAVAHKLIPRTHFDNTLRVPPPESAVVACIVLGLWLFAAHALPSLAQYLSIAVFLFRNHQPLSEAGVWNLARLFEGLFEFAFALVLTLKARAIVTYLLAVRPLGED
jgi:hypothetical protein